MDDANGANNHGSSSALIPFICVICVLSRTTEKTKNFYTQCLSIFPNSRIQLTQFIHLFNQLTCNGYHGGLWDTILIKRPETSGFIEILGLFSRVLDAQEEGFAIWSKPWAGELRISRG